MFGRFKWWFVGCVTILVGIAGLMFGKAREGEYLSRFKPRADFLLLDDRNEFFYLKDLAEGRLLLMIFPPDGLSPTLVRPFGQFSRKVEDLAKRGVDAVMVARGNHEIAKNFKRASHFPGRLLLDAGGTVGRNLGVWPDRLPAVEWSYVLLDRTGTMVWGAAAKTPLSYDELLSQLKAQGFKAGQ